MKMVNIKKLLAMLLALVMVLGMVACGRANEPGQSPNQPGQSANQPGQSSNEPAGEIVINFPCIWVGTDSKAPYFAQMVEAFNAENAGSIKVVIEEQTDYQAYRDKVRTLVTTGNVPDICTLDTLADVPLYTASGKFMDMTPHLNAGWKDTFADGVFDAWTVDGKISVIPFESAIFPICYNTEILKAAGWDTFPSTWDEMFEMFKDIKAAGYNAVGQMAGENAWTSMLWYSLLVEAIGGPDVYANGMDDPAFVEAAAMLKEMYEYTFDGAISAGAGDVNGHFIARDTALYLNGPWWIANFYKEDNAVDGQLLADVVKVASNPRVEGGKGTPGGLTTTVQSFLLCAKQDDPAKEAAVVKFVQYITDPDRMAEWSLSAGSMFFAKYTPSENATQISKDFTALANAAPYTVLHVNGQFPAAYATEFPNAVSSLVLGQVDEAGFVEMLKTAVENS